MGKGEGEGGKREGRRRKGVGRVGGWVRVRKVGGRG